MLGVLLAPGGRPGRTPGPPYLSRRCCSLLLAHFRRQQVRKATDMSRMMAQLTMEAITATLKPKVSWAGTAVRETRPASEPGPAARPAPGSPGPQGRWGGPGGGLCRLL